MYKIFRFSDFQQRDDARAAIGRRGWRVDIIGYHQSDLKITWEPATPHDYDAACDFCEGLDPEPQIVDDGD